MHVSALREGGPFSVESISRLGGNETGLLRPGEVLRTTECVTVYADTDQPSHSVRLWFHVDAPTAMVRA